MLVASVGRGRTGLPLARPLEAMGVLRDCLEGVGDVAPRLQPWILGGLRGFETSEGSDASDAENLAKPVLPDTELALICNARGNDRAFLQTMPCSHMHAG
eukprot:306569-Pelagomonas_calceolata.AAC.1